MALIDTLKAALNSNVSVYIRFLQQYRNLDKDIHVFHEGKDDPSFYGNYLEKYIGKKRKVFYHKASNKAQVYINYQNIDWSTHDKKRVIFLVDKDFSDLLGLVYKNDINIFVTSYYSIENYIVNTQVLNRVIVELIGVNDARNAIIINHYRESVRSFYESMLIIIAYIVYHKRLGNKPMISNIKLADYFSISDDVIFKKKKNLLAKLDSVCQVNTSNSVYKIAEIVRELKAIPQPKIYLRGKYEMSFFVKFINSITKILNNGLGQNQEKAKLCVSISDGNAIQILAPRTKRPKEIKLFLDSILT